MIRKKIENQLIAKALTDEAFKQQLTEDPRTVIEQEYGVKLPPGMVVTVLEEKPNTLYLVLPINPEKLSDIELSDDDLNTISGGGSQPSTCYIATATLTGGGSQAQLRELRKWRDRVLCRSRIGRLLEKYYDFTGPSVAARVQDRPLLANSFLYPFVKPAVWLAGKRFRHTWGWLLDLPILLIFFTGMLYGSGVYLFFQLTNEEVPLL